MRKLSEVLLARDDIDSFQRLVQVIEELGRSGVITFEFDIQPPFKETPPDWESELERAFTRR